MVEILENPTIQAAVRAEQFKDGLRAILANSLMSTKTWSDMNKDERMCCVQHVVGQSETEAELQQKLSEELGAGYCAIDWNDVDPSDKTALEAQALVKALGGLISKSGALVMIMTPDDMF